MGYGGIILIRQSPHKDHLLYPMLFPDRLKISIAKPTLKEGDNTSTTNCRPISILIVFLKYWKWLCTLD